jgi:hypothetical protein
VGATKNKGEVNMCEMREPPIKIILKDGTVVENPYRGIIYVVETGVEEPKRPEDFVENPGVYLVGYIYGHGGEYKYWSGKEWFRENNDYYRFPKNENGYKFFEGPKDYYIVEECPEYKVIYNKEENIRTPSYVDGLPDGGFIQKASLSGRLP